MRIAPPDKDRLAEAAERLRGGGLVAFPTETVYGLGGDASNPGAVAAIFEVKARPAFNPLIVHVTDLDAAKAFGRFNEHANTLADEFWPGPLSIVVPRSPDGAVCDLACAGSPTIALRSPAHPVAQALLNETGLPLAAPSANPSGYLSPTTAQHVAEAFADKDMLILDGGPCPIGLESTVVDCSQDGSVHLLRSGGVTLGDLRNAVGEIEVTSHAADGQPRSPGMLARHYAPRLGLRLNADSVENDEALLAFGPVPPQGAMMTLNLSSSGDLLAAAANLFAMLHVLEQSGARRIAVMPIPESGLGRAINDRLRRGAAGTAETFCEPDNPA